MELSTKAALGHIIRALGPRVVVTHGDAREYRFFWNGVKSRAKQMKVTHVGLPGPASDFKWIAKLDSSSLEGLDPYLMLRVPFVNSRQPGIKSI